MEKFKILVVLLVLITLLTGNTQVTFAEIKSDGTPKIAQGNTDFAINLYKQLSNSKGNIFFSPFSISTAVSIVYSGARGNTESQIKQVFHFLPDQNSQHQAYGKILKSYQQSDPAASRWQTFKLNIANAVWVEKQYKFLKSFLDVAEANYGSVLFNVDFKNAFESARKQINKWVEEQTKGKIKDLIGPNVLNSSTRFVITNAIYFKGKWKNTFRKSATTPKDFYITPTSLVKVPMMSQTDDFKYMENASFQMLEMPYEFCSIAMYVILPKKLDGLSDVEASLTSAVLNNSFKSLETREVVTSFPKYKIDSQFELSKILSKMGMPDAFVFGKADFSGINGNKELYISTVIHKAFVDVDEEGTEAAAATAIAGVAGCAMPEPKPKVEFNANHPFIYLIRDSKNETILFMGRIKKPN